MNHAQRRILGGALLILGGTWTAWTALATYVDFTTRRALPDYDAMSWTLAVVLHDAGWRLGVALAIITLGLYVRAGGSAKTPTPN